MKSKELFAMALGVQDPWFIKEIEFGKEGTEKEKELHIYFDFYKGTKFKSTDGGAYSAYDTRSRRWRHLNFFEHRCYLYCEVPRVQKQDGKVEMVEVPWARAGSGFTLLFECFALSLIENEMPVNKAAKILQENASRLWTTLNFYVGSAYERADHSNIEQLGIDETSVRKGHQYITTAVDMDEHKIVHVTTGKSKKSVARIREYLDSKSCPPEQISQISLDMSPSFIAGTLEEFPNACLTFDRFHVKKLLNKAMDKVRRIERKEHEMLKGHKYTFLKDPKKLSDKRKNKLSELITLYPTLGEAYRLKLLFDDLWNMETINRAESFLEDWCEQCKKSNILPFIDFVNTVYTHWYGIVQYINSKLTNGILEGLNTKIQLAKRRARGFRQVDNFITMIYLLAGKLDLAYPHKTL